ncbi:MAG: short chain dehydrogenase, partial [Polyangiaceae bacterium]|nr:short chain dehydrogenase [Polyangiaceae bacterium]
RGVSEVLRFDLERHAIRVSLVCPGGVNTGLVETVKVAGADPSSAAFKRLKRRFEKHAVSPERAAGAIVRGVEKNRYHVYTSRDIAVGHWFQRKLALPYELVMRRMNREFDAVSAKGERR